MADRSRRGPLLRLPDPPLPNPYYHTPWYRKWGTRAIIRRCDCNGCVQPTKLKELPEIGMAFDYEKVDIESQGRRQFVVHFIAPAQQEEPKRNFGERFS